MLKSLWRLNAVLALGVSYVTVAFCAVMVSSIVLQVVTRVAFNRSPPWTEEIALLMFGWIVLLMLAIGVRENAHVRVGALVEWLPQELADFAERMISLLIGAIAVFLVWAGAGSLMEMRGSTSAAIRYPIELLYASMPVSTAVMAMFAFENVVRGVPKSGQRSR